LFDGRHRLLDVSTGCRCGAQRKYVDYTLSMPWSQLMPPDGRGSDTQAIADARRITGEPEGSDYVPTDARELCGRIMHTCYMGTENSSAETRGRAKELAEAIGRFVSSLTLTFGLVDLTGTSVTTRT
jgi:hypothetical protein